MSEAQLVVLTSEQIATEVAHDLPEGTLVNLGIGMPQRVAQFISADREVILHAENGIIGAGPRAATGAEDWNLIDAGKVPITLKDGGCFTSHVDSFILVRGGHIDVSVIGAYQVSAAGDLANWSQGEGIPGVGGAMDLAAGAKQVFVMMRHTTREGAPKLVSQCTLPLTGSGCVTRVYTELGIFEPRGSHFIALALTEGVTIEHVQNHTAVPVELLPDYFTVPRPAHNCVRESCSTATRIRA